MICANCRHDSDDDANYCRICGHAFDDAEIDASDSKDVAWGEHVFFPRHGWAIAFFVLVVFVFGLLALSAML